MICFHLCHPKWHHWSRLDFYTWAGFSVTLKIFHLTQSTFLQALFKCFQGLHWSSIELVYDFSGKLRLCLETVFERTNRAPRLWRNSSRLHSWNGRSSGRLDWKQIEKPNAFCLHWHGVSQAINWVTLQINFSHSVSIYWIFLYQSLVNISRKILNTVQDFVVWR